VSPPDVEALRTVAFRGNKVAVIDVGDGPVLGYLHGMLGNPIVHPFLGALAGRHRVVAPSMPGFIPSPPCTDLRFLYDWVSALSEVVDLAGLAGQPVVASSVGAMLALELASLRPGVFERLVVISPLGLWDDEHPVADAFGRPSFEQRSLLLEDPAKASVFFEEDMGADRAAALEHGIARYNTRRAAASLVWPLPDHGLADRIHRASCPVGIVWGEDDRLNPVEGAQTYAARLPHHAGTRTIARAGHCVEWDRPVETAAAVDELLA
jgi:pimeloyl-ACP methyl ester carboxylesterase